MHTYLACLGTEHISLDTNKVSQVQAFLEHDIVQILVLIGTDGIPLDIYLDATFAVLQLCKTGFTHDSLAHDTACNAYIATILGCGRSRNFLPIGSLHCGQVNKRAAYLGTPCIHRIFCSRIRVNTQVTQLLEIVSPYYLLIAQFQYVHSNYSLIKTFFLGRKVTQNYQMWQERCSQISFRQRKNYSPPNFLERLWILRADSICRSQP